MISSSTLAIYLPAVVFLVLTPGPAILFTLNRSLSFGRRAGFVTAAGLLSGTCILQVSAVLGVSAILQVSPIAYAVLKVTGALYLVYLGVRTILAVPADLGDAAPAGPPRWWRQDYLGGLTTELLNPKTAMFYVSVLPQFVDLHAGQVTAQLLLLGGVFVVFAAGSLAMVVLSSVHVKSLLLRHPGYESLSRWITGSVFIGFGARLALERQ